MHGGNDEWSNLSTRQWCTKGARGKKRDGALQRGGGKSPKKTREVERDRTTAGRGVSAIRGGNIKEVAGSGVTGGGGVSDGE